MNVVLGILGALALCIVAIWAFTANNVAVTRTLGIAQENANRQVFEHSQSYVQGKVDYLSQLRLEYQSAEPGSPHQKALRSMILTQAATVNRNELPPELSAFVSSLEDTQ